MNLLKRIIHGVPVSEEIVPDEMPTSPPTRSLVGRDEVLAAGETLRKYKSGKASLEARIIEDEQWWKLRHWDYLRKKENTDPSLPQPTTAWLFNSLLNKHADMMDNYPEARCLPRERHDERDAAILSDIVPVIMERNDFAGTYSDNAWYKLKHGTSAYGVFWNNELDNGLGNIDISRIDLLNIFWEPSITDIQDSRNLFIVDVVDNEVLEKKYPELKDKCGANVIEVADYIYDDTVDNSGKTVVVDWYYKVTTEGGGTLLHYCKFAGDTLIFASENDERYAAVGWYEHGRYPVVFDVLYPEEGTPYGFGVIAICKDPQLYIDKLEANILENAMKASKVRFFVKKNAGVNVAQFLDLSQPVVEVEGDISEERLRQITVAPLSDIYYRVLQLKINELKDTSANRDFSNGSVSSGVTAASAIAALQEAGNKTARDMISASYRAYTKLTHFVIEMIRQFYDEARSFRIVGVDGAGFDFVDYSNSGIKDQPLPPIYAGQETMYRRPIFDIDVRAQKKNPYSQMSQNETAKELYRMGVFNPQMADQALMLLDIMNFDGIEAVKEKIMGVAGVRPPPDHPQTIPGTNKDPLVRLYEG